jgi:hypothetical protein
MMRSIALILLFICLEARGHYLFVEGDKKGKENKWTEFSQNPELNIQNLLQMLAKSQVGKELIQKATKKAKRDGTTLLQAIEPGSGSITDTTLIRRFSPSDPENVSYETRSKVYLNKNLTTYDAILDLAHELTHYVFREGFNPYQKNFSLEAFIKSTVEAEGGEVHAFLMECKILSELFPKQIANRYNCKKIIDPSTGKFSRELAVKKFYSLGGFFEKFNAKLAGHGISDHFPNISKDEVSFVSSAYGMPYPLAAYHEYMTVLGKVCENDKKRMAYIGRSAAPSRSPASAQFNKARQEYLDRCSSVVND